MLQMNIQENNSRISITIEVIRYITLYYFSVAIILTMGQVIYEYTDIKKNIKSKLFEHSRSFQNSLSNSLWEFNENQTKTILQGILQTPSTTGVLLYDAKGEILYDLGDTPKEKNDENYFSFIKKDYYFSQTVDLTKSINEGPPQQVGRVIFYSSNRVVLEQLSRIIFYIIVNSILKTLSLWAILVIFFNSKIKKPLRNLVGKIKAINPHDPKAISINRKDHETEEVYQIVETVNYLIKELRTFKEILEAIIENKTELIKEKNIEVRKLVNKLENAQTQIINQEKLNSLGLVSAGIAHELKNPLNISKNTILILRSTLKIQSDDHKLQVERLSEADLEQVPQLVKIIVDSNERMETIIRNMLLQSRSENTKPTEINLDSFIQMNLRVVQKSLKSKSSEKTKTSFLSEDNLNGEIFVSEFGRLLVNLYENAFFAIDEKLKKTSLSDYEPEIKTIIKSDAKNIIITIKDNGIGIDPELKNKIMEPFFTTKPTGVGTGLGLYLSYEIIKKHHGEIMIDSDSGHYTEITMTIPKNLKDFYS